MGKFVRRNAPFVQYITICGETEKPTMFLSSENPTLDPLAAIYYSFVKLKTMSVTKRWKDSFWTNCL